MKKQSEPLVCQHLEGLSRTALESYQKIIRDHVRGRQGVYALYRKNKLYYVGLASDLSWRLKAHLVDRHGEKWDAFSVYLTIGATHLKELESLLLRVIKPRPIGNNQSGKFAKSENLRPKFRNDAKSFFNNELEAVMGRSPRKLAPPPKVTGARAELVRLLKGRTGVLLRGTYKRKTYKAKVRKDGSVSYGGSIYNSPSAAAVAVTGRERNGWDFWHFERAPGDWVRLDELRPY